MKKRFLTAAVLSIGLLMALTACTASPKAKDGDAQAEAPTEAPAETQAEAPTEAPAETQAATEPADGSPLHKHEGLEPDLVSAALARTEEFKAMAPMPEDERLENIPVYDADDLLFKLNFIGKDNNADATTNIRFNSTESFLAHYPGAALRKFEDGHAYMVYDADNGYRLFIQFGEKYGYSASYGYPVVIKEQHSCADFEGLKVGDSIDKVCEIDSVGLIYKKLFSEVYCIDAQNARITRECGEGPYSSMHYLTDGILRIEYDFDEKMNATIANMVYSPDYVLSGMYDIPVNYRIAEVDLP
ncbi:MAG: hypothetical protein IKS43_07855 [Clostridia bacterium]|nr:hypothetical protein [Clostridia bacterium]